MAKAQNNNAHSRTRPSRVATIKAQDENGDLDIKISFSSKVLTRKEIDTTVRNTVRIITSAISGLSYTDYGIDNIKVKI